MHFPLYLLQTTATPEQLQQAQKILAIFLPIMGLFFVVALIIVILPCWFICKKAGFTPWLSLLCLVPTVGLLVLLYVLAFADWKVAPVPQQAWGPLPPYPPQPPYPPPPQPPYPPQS